jgi:hypothetical protein
LLAAAILNLKLFCFETCRKHQATRRVL